MEGQFAGWTIKGGVRNRDGRETVQQNEEQIWGNSRGRKENRVVEDNWTREKNLWQICPGVQENSERKWLREVAPYWRI